MGHPASRNQKTFASERPRRRRRKRPEKRVDPADVPFFDAVDRFLEHRDRNAWITRDYSAANTLESYHYRLRALCAFVAARIIRDRGDVDLGALNPSTAKTLVNQTCEDVTLDDFDDDTIPDYLYLEARRGISARTRNARLYSFRPFFRWVAETYDDEALDICFDVEKSQVQPRKMRGVTAEHWNVLVERLEARAGEARHGWRDLVIFKTMRYFGRRISEIANLDRESIYEQRDTLVIEYVGKGNKHRSKRLPLFGETGRLDWVHRYRDDLEHYRRTILPRRYKPGSGHEKALFLSQKHARITVRQIERALKDLLKELGLHREAYTPHSLRHGFARAKLDDGVGLRKLQKLLDHASIRTTEVYLDADEEELTEAMGRGVDERSAISPQQSASSDREESAVSYQPSAISDREESAVSYQPSAISDRREQDG